MGAAVDLAGMGVRVVDTVDSFDDREIDNATEIVKQSLTGELTSDVNGQRLCPLCQGRADNSVEDQHKCPGKSPA